MTNDRKADIGAREISYACSYVPIEIIMAAGLLPKRMIPEPRPSAADAYIYPNTCYHIKSLLAAGLAGDASRTAGIVFANSCAGMRRLHDLWKEYVKDIPAVFLDIPKKKDTDSIEFFASELRRFAQNLETDFSGAHVTDEALHEAISACNNVRVLMDEIFKLQRDTNSTARGLSVFELCMEESQSSATGSIERLKTFISESRETKLSGKEVRIVLTGNIIHQPDLITLIEDAGGRVAVLDTCMGARNYDSLVREKSQDPMLALAERYLTKASCARMEGLDERFQRTRDLAVGSMADGIIYSAVKFCDMYLYEAPSMETGFRKAGIPFLFLENDYEWTGLEQIKTRVEAFLTMISERGARRNV